MTEAGNTAPTSRSRGWVKAVTDIAIVLLVVTAAKSTLAEPYYVPSGSMEPTLLIGDELLAVKYPYGYGTASLPASFAVPASGRLFGALPERGDVVVFRWPGDPTQIWVKRVIGLPGDRIALRDGQVFINGEPAQLKPDGTGEMKDSDGNVTMAARYSETLPGGRSHAIYKFRSAGMFDNMDEITVPAGDLFVMGDNRDDSADSRVPLRSGGVGLLPAANLVGRVDALVGSWDMTIRDKPVWEWPSGLRLSRFFSSVN